MFENRRHPTPKGRGPANTGQRDPNVPSPNATTATAQADPKFHDCLARGGTRYEAFKQHKSRQDGGVPRLYGLTAAPAHERAAKPPPMMSQGPMHRRLVLARIRVLADRGFVPTDEELTQTVSMEHLADIVFERAKAATGQGEDPTDGESEESDGHRARSRSRHRQ